MTVKEVAKLYRTNVATIRYLARRGRIVINKVEDPDAHMEICRSKQSGLGYYPRVRKTYYREYIEPEEVERLDDMLYRYLLDPFDDSYQNLTRNERYIVRCYIKKYKMTHADILLILIEDMRS